MQKKSKMIYILAAIVLAFAAVVFFVKRDGQKGPLYKTQTVTRGDIKATVTATGTVNPVVNVSVGTQVSGTIKKLYADFNSKVKKGQLLALIDPATFEAQVGQAQANLFSAQANLDKAKATEVDAKRTMLRNKTLLAQNLVAQSDFDTAQTNYLTAQASTEAAKGQVRQAQAALKVAQTNLAYTKIVSPVDGTVVSRNVDVGQTVAASFQTPTLFTIARDLRKMQIDTSVNEADVGGIRTGQAVEFTVDAYPDSIFKGKVSQVRIAPITVQNVVTYDVVITVDNSDLRLIPGMTANVSIITDVEKNVLRVPNAALRFRMPGKTAGQGAGGAGGGQVVWALAGVKPVPVRIKPGLSDGNYTQVVSGRLPEGAKVIVEALEKGKTGERRPGVMMFH
ncbi:MAG: efflux RND transporter periplasmic adaptor subunit [Actinomycetota bacterium]|nr:efflux RND transporter periplasmic adaptor subunit [Actinomycetota bacterium]